MSIRLTAPECYVRWINEHLGFNPRGQQQSDYLSACILNDLRLLSPKLASDLDDNRLVWKINHPVHSRILPRVVDLVLFDPLEPGPLDQVRLTVENKTLMTAHGKARKNRVGDLAAYCNHVHNHAMTAIVGATMIINVSSAYHNPNGFADGVLRRSLSTEYVRDTMKLFTDFPLREAPTEASDCPEALAVMLVHYDGAHEAHLVTEPPALTPDNPYHYDNFCKRLVRLYEERFSS